MAVMDAITCGWCGELTPAFGHWGQPRSVCSASCGKKLGNQQRRLRRPTKTAFWHAQAQRWVDPIIGAVYQHKQFGTPVTTRDSDGYIAVSGLVDGVHRSFKGHHLIYEVVCGSVQAALDEGFEINHLDFDRTNNRFDNLDLIPGGDNLRYSADAGRLVSFPGETNALAKLTETDVLHIWDRLNAGVAPKQIAAEFGVTRGNVYLIKRGQTWKHVSPLP